MPWPTSLLRKLATAAQLYVFWQRRRYATGLSLRVGVVIGSPMLTRPRQFFGRGTTVDPGQAWQHASRRLYRSRARAGRAFPRRWAPELHTHHRAGRMHASLLLHTHVRGVGRRSLATRLEEARPADSHYEMTIHSLDRARLATQPRPPHKDAATNSPCSARPASRRSPPPTARQRHPAPCLLSRCATPCTPCR